MNFIILFIHRVYNRQSSHSLSANAHALQVRHACKSGLIMQLSQTRIAIILGDLLFWDFVAKTGQQCGTTDAY